MRKHSKSQFIKSFRLRFLETARRHKPFAFINTPETYLKRLIKTPGHRGISKLAVLLEARVLKEDETGIMSGITERLVETFVRQSKGDKTARKQIEIIWRTLFPEKYGLDETHVENALSALDVFKKTTLGQGFEVRKMMAFLSRAVEPVPPGRTVLDGKVRLAKKSEWNIEEYKAARSAFERLEKKSDRLVNLAIDVLLHQKNILNEETKKKQSKYLHSRFREVELWELDLRCKKKLPKQIKSSKEMNPSKEITLPFGVKPKWLVVCGGEETEHLLYLDFADSWKG